MRKWLNIYFDLSKREFTGLLVLIGLILFIKILPELYILIRPEVEDIPSEQLAIRELGTLKEPWPKQDSQEAHVRGEELFYFDPNTITAEQWQKLGLSEKQAEVIMRYRAKGGNFRVVKDLQKMYTISAATYTRIAPYVRIKGQMDWVRRQQDEVFASHQRSSVSSKLLPKGMSSLGKPMAVVEVNQADSMRLEEIRGVGPAFARRILKYRERLGGFYKKEQLREVYGLDSAKYEEIKNQVKVDVSLIHQININTVTFDELKNHPYLRYKQINAIVQYRKQHGDYASISDLQKVAILSAETIDKIAPYLVF